MAHLAAMFAGWNLLVLLIMIALCGVGALSERFRFVELVVRVLLVSVGLLILIIFSPIAYLLVKEHKTTHGNYFRYLVDGIKRLIGVV